MKSRFIKIVSFVLLACAAVMLPVVLAGEGNYPRIAQLGRQLDSLARENRKIRWELGELEKLIVKMRSDPQLIKKVARQEFGYVSPDEVIFIVE